MVPAAAEASFGETFLTFPALFPGRRSGETRGQEELLLDLPGGPFLFSGLGAGQRRDLEERFGAFLAQRPPRASRPAVETRVFAVPAEEFRPLDVRGWEYRLEIDPAPESVRFAGLGLMGRLEWSPALAGGLWTAAVSGETFLGAFENYLRVLAAYRLVEMGGALLHSAAVVSGDSAWVFFGASGAGKTTVARLSEATGRAVLSDDLNALWKRGGRTRVAQVPFAGDFGRAAPRRRSRPLARLLRLRQGEDHGLRPLTPSEALAALVACSPFVNGDPHRSGALLTALQALAEEVPADELTFRRDDGFWALVEEGVPRP